jgi:hypothetical protein
MEWKAFEDPAQFDLPLLQVLPGEQQQAFLENLGQKASWRPLPFRPARSL